MSRQQSPAQIANLNRGYIKPPKTAKSVTFDLEPELIAELDESAKAKNISRSAEIRYRLEQYQPTQKP